MNFSLDADQLEFATTLRRALAERAPLTRWLTAAEADGAWDFLTAELQANAPDVPAEFGGLGLTEVELAITAEELGRVVAPAAFVAGAGLAQSLLLATGERAAKPLTESVDGRRFTLGADPAGTWADLTLDEDSTVSGTFVAPVGARDADAVVALARTTSGGRAVVVADLDPNCVAPLDGIDTTAGSARVTMRRQPAAVYAVDGLDLIEASARRRARLVVAAQALGGARSCLDMTVAYAQQREQFGRPIGAFQAVKHRLADLFVETELAASAVYLAACEINEAAGERSTAAALDIAVSTYQRAARDCIQLHGGMGFTWEYPAHLHLERAQLLASLLGPQDAGERYAAIHPGDE